MLSGMTLNDVVSSISGESCHLANRRKSNSLFKSQLEYKNWKTSSVEYIMSPNNYAVRVDKEMEENPSTLFGTRMIPHVPEAREGIPMEYAESPFVSILLFFFQYYKTSSGVNDH